MTASSLDLSDRADLLPLAEVVAAMRRAKRDAEPLLVGAMARDALLVHAHGIQTGRATEDFDFAFVVNDWHGYDELRYALIASGAFTEVPRVAHRLLFAGNRKVDLVPFGGVEHSDGTIIWPSPQDTQMVALGFREALRAAIRLELPDSVSIAVASLPAQALLKLFAWGDRRYEQPGKDAGDLHLLLSAYLEAGNRERLYSEAAHLFDADDYDDNRAGAWLLGTDARKLLVAESNANGAALTKGLALLTPEIQPDGPLHLAADIHGTNLQRTVDLLSAFYAGLSGAENP